MNTKPIPILTPNDIVRFDAKVLNKTEDGCWLWNASKDEDGYGRFGIGTTVYLAHRVAYTMKYGAIPEGLELDHTCHNPSCVRPSHLEPVDRSQQILRSYRRDGLIASNSKRTHCSQGHPYDNTNTYLQRDGRRGCKICRSRRSREQWERKKEQALHLLPPPTEITG